MNLSSKEFQDRIQELADIHFPDANLRTREYSKFRIKLRLIFSVDFFVEVFYAPQTAKVSFTLIKDEERIFGIDNLGGWHRHPVKNPSNHIDISEPKFKEIFEWLKKAKEEKNS